MLHPTAGVLSARNQYIQQCASVLDRALRAHRSCIQAHATRRLGEVFGVGGWRPEVKVEAVDEIPLPRALATGEWKSVR